MEAVIASTSLLEWGVAERALEGQTENGDMYLVQPLAEGILVAVVDGLGHGREAATAARMAVDTLGQFAGEPLSCLFARCHERLRPTRGVVMSAAVVHPAEGWMAWLGVGNVEGVLQRANPGIRPVAETLLLRSGVLGSHVPRLGVMVLAVQPGDVLILATDGIRREFAEERLRGLAAQQAAERVLARYARHTDDALVLVARCHGGVA